MIFLVDAEAAVRAWANAVPGLAGPGNPLLNGTHIGQVRSPSEGAIATIELIGPRTTDDVTDDARVAFVVSAIGKGGGRRAAQRGAAALAEALLVLHRAPVIVTLEDGVTVRLVGADNVQGPTYAGDLGGEQLYRVDATMRCQPG